MIRENSRKSEFAGVMEFGCRVGSGRRIDRSWRRECAGSQPGDGVGECRIVRRERERTG